MEKLETTMRDALADFLGMLSHKARTGELNADDAATIYRAICDAGGIHATVRDLAGYYGQSENTVRHVINRNLLPAPERRVYHDFAAFRKRVPAGWTKRGCKSGR